MSGPTCGHGNTAAVCETCEIERLEAKLEEVVVAAQPVFDIVGGYTLGNTLGNGIGPAIRHLKATITTIEVDTISEKATSEPGCDPVCKCLKGSGISEIDCDVHGIKAKKNAQADLTG